MGSNSDNPWIWSEEYNDHYMWVLGPDGTSVCQWAFQNSDNSGTALAEGDQKGKNKDASVGSFQHIRADSGHDEDMAPPAPNELRHTIKFQGTPNLGWHERLDPRYRMRTMSEAHRFFVKGRVFAMLWAETASPTMARNGTDVTAVTIGRFGENVYSQIRRFVVMQVNRQKHFVYACPIFTYGGQGVLKKNCLASEHAIVYLNNKQPTYLPGEREKGLCKEPIEIKPSDPTEQMAPASRLRFGKHHSIEWNVKVREIGIVSSRHMSKLISYYKEESENGFDDDNHYSAQDEDNGISETPTQPTFQQAEFIQPTFTGESYTQTSYPYIAPTQMNYTPPAWSQSGSTSAYTTNYPAQYERR